MGLSRFWEAPGPPKIKKKSKKSCLGRFGGFDRFTKRFKNNFGRFWMDFDRIFEAFGKDLRGRTMIRATKGKSIEKT